MESVIWPAYYNEKCAFENKSHEDKIKCLAFDFNYDEEMLSMLSDDELVNLYIDTVQDNADKALPILFDDSTRDCVDDVFYLIDDKNNIKKYNSKEILNSLVSDRYSKIINDDLGTWFYIDGIKYKLLGCFDLEDKDLVNDTMTTEDEYKLAIDRYKPIMMQEALQENKLQEVKENDPDSLEKEYNSIKKLYDDFGVEYFTAMPFINFDNDTTSIEYNYPHFAKIVKAFFKEMGIIDKENINNEEELANNWWYVDDTDFKTLLSTCKKLIDKKGSSQQIERIYTTTVNQEDKVEENKIDDEHDLKLNESVVTDIDEVKDKLFDYIENAQESTWKEIFEKFSEWVLNWKHYDIWVDLISKAYDIPVESVMADIKNMPVNPTDCINIIDMFVSAMCSQKYNVKAELYDFICELNDTYIVDAEEPEQIVEQLNPNNDIKDYIACYRFNAGLKDDEPITEDLDKFAIDRTCCKYYISPDRLKEELLKNANK